MHKKISVEELFGIAPDSPDLFFSFEVDYQPYQKMITGTLPRIDLVTRNTTTDKSLSGVEVKLTALPDHGTANLTEDKYGCEIVVRPDTIVYQALSIASSFQTNRPALREALSSVCADINDWRDEHEMAPKVNMLAGAIRQIVKSGIHRQRHFVLQPIWKTVGKSAQLAEHCLDVFVWSDVALMRLFMDESNEDQATGTVRIRRPARSIIWLTKMLYDFSQEGRFNPSAITNQLSYSSRTDKAFALAGASTHKHMTCAELTKPRISKSEIKNIILGGGQNFLSPERRFDAIIANTPNLFK